KLAALGFAGIRLAVDQDGGIVLARVDYQHAAAAAGVNPGREHGSGTSRYCKLAVVFPVVEGQFMVARGDIFQVDAVSSRVSLRLTVERHLHRHNAGANMDLAAKTAGQDGGEIFGRDGTLKRGRRSGSGYKREFRLTAFLAGDFDVVCTGSQMIENGLSILQRSHKLAIQNHLAAIAEVGEDFERRSLRDQRQAERGWMARLHRDTLEGLLVARENRHQVVLSRFKIDAAVRLAC